MTTEIIIAIFLGLILLSLCFIIWDISYISDQIEHIKYELKENSKDKNKKKIKEINKILKDK